MEKMMMKIPLGFHFAPSDKELITSYLLRRAMALPLMPSGREHRHILETDLYREKADPWLVFQDVPDSRWEGDDDVDGKEKRVIYVVTKLTKISKGKTRIARRAGCGTWSGQTPPKKIYDESGQWVGTMRMLSFERPKGEEQYHHDPRDQHHWIMHEYSLDGIYNNNNNSNKVDKEYVICRITRVFKGKSPPLAVSTALVPCGDIKLTNNYTETTRNIDTSAQDVHEEDVVRHPNKKRKREIIITQQVDQGRRRRCKVKHDDVSSSEGEADHQLPLMTADQMQQVESVVSVVDDDSDPDFDDWMDNLLLDLPEEDHTQAAVASNQLDSSVLQTAQQPDGVDQYDQASSTTILAADWMSLLDDVELPEDDQDDQNSNHNMNSTTTACFNLDHLDLFQELCY